MNIIGSGSRVIDNSNFYDTNESNFYSEAKFLNILKNSDLVFNLDNYGILSKEELISLHNKVTNLNPDSINEDHKKSLLELIGSVINYNKSIASKLNINKIKLSYMLLRPSYGIRLDNNIITVSNKLKAFCIYTLFILYHDYQILHNDPRLQNFVYDMNKYHFFITNFDNATNLDEVNIWKNIGIESSKMSYTESKLVYEKTNYTESQILSKNISDILELKSKLPVKEKLQKYLDFLKNMTIVNKLENVKEYTIEHLKMITYSNLFSVLKMHFKYDRNTEYLDEYFWFDDDKAYDICIYMILHLQSYFTSYQKLFKYVLKKRQRQDKLEILRIKSKISSNKFPMDLQD